MAEEFAEDAIATADAILPLIKRHPDGLEKAELRTQSGFDTAELREGLAVLLGQEKIEETDDGYREKKAAPAAATSKNGDGAEEEPEDPDGEGATAVDPAAPPSVPGQEQSYRATFEITATFGGPKKDEGAMQIAAAMEEDLANKIHEMYPQGVVSVDVKRIEAYRPRVIFAADVDEDAAS